MSRRSDTRLRSAISVLEGMLLTDPSTDDILLRCLNQAMSLLNTEYGFVYRCLGRMEETIPWELVGTSAISNSTLIEIENTSTSSFIPLSIRDRLITGRCIYSTNPTQRSNGSPHHDIPAPHNHPLINNYIAIPLVDAKSIHGVIYVCNNLTGFDDNTATRIRPFITASSCLLRASQTRAKFQAPTPPLDNSGGSLPPNFVGLLDRLFNAVFLVNDNGIITLCNTAASTMIDHPRHKLIGRTLSDFLPRGAPAIEGRLTDELEPEMVEPNGKVVWRGVPALKNNGDKLLVDLRAFEFKQDKEIIRGIILDDISERMQSSADYQSILQRFQVLTNLVPVGILQINREWRCTYANDTWCEYCQITPEESRGVGWIRGIHPLDADKILHEMRTATSIGDNYTGEFRLLSPLGKITWVKASACVLYEETGAAGGLIITFHDITSQLKNEKRLQDIAETDQLTGLVNRAFFNDRIEIALKGVGRFGSVALMFIDLDEFKHINDTLGHDTGDVLLKEVASRLKDTLRNIDTIARIGGDEFTLIMTNVQNTRSISIVADKIIDSFAEPFLIGKNPLYVSCSVGISVAETEEVSSEQLLKQADMALYRAKDAGKNQYKYYTNELNEDAGLHILLRQSLKESASRDFKVVYQPQVNAVSGEIIGVEALTRWNRKNAPPTGPEKFIKMMEESGLINDFSDWLLNSIFNTIRNWSETGSTMDTLPVSINISAKQFRNKDLANYIHKLCLSYCVKPSRIVLEVTETAFISDSKLAAQTLQTLKNMGFCLALDDFGTGYSSLAYLREMPLNTVKIDRSFINNVLHDKTNAQIVSSIIGLANALNLKVVAEGVENTDVKQWLVEHNCPIHQGFHFYKPLEGIELENIFKLHTPIEKVVMLQSTV